MRIINAREVRRLLPMADCIDAMERAMVAASTGGVFIPPRMVMPLIDKSGFLGLMPGSAADPKVYGAKVMGMCPANPDRGLPLIQGFVVLFDPETGAPAVLMEGAEITAIRTAAASGLATRVLAGEHASSCGIFGTGVQAATHISAMAAVRPVSKFIIWGRNPDKARALMESVQGNYDAAFETTDDPARAAACEIVCTVTASPEPVINGDWLKPGAHLNVVGSHTPAVREADTGTIRRSAVYVDLMESARNEAGDILIPIQEGAIGWDHVRGEIGAVLAGDIGGRSSPEQITLYKSQGITAQDLYAAELVYRRALESGAGVEVDF